MLIKDARNLAAGVRERLEPHCSKFQIVGSIRRRRLLVNDIDVLLIPQSQGKLIAAFQEMGPVKMGPKIITLDWMGRQVDLYVATPETWFTLLLIRTGSTQHNIKLTTLAKKKGWHLYADGRGLFNEKGVRVAGDSEESFFQALGIPYVEPWRRG